VAIEEVMPPDKSSVAAGQVFEPNRPHKSLHVRGRRPKTKTLVTGLEAARASDMPSKSVGGRKLAGGFDSRPPPLPNAPSDQRRSAEPGHRRPREGPIRARTTASTTPVFRSPLRPAPDKSSDRPPEDRTSLRTPSSRRRGGSGVGRPVGRPMARKPITLEDFREEFLAHCGARNLSGKTVEWYNDRTRRFADWCATQGIRSPSDFRWSDLEHFTRRRGLRRAESSFCSSCHMSRAVRRLRPGGVNRTPDEVRDRARPVTDTLPKPTCFVLPTSMIGRRQSFSGRRPSAGSLALGWNSE